MVYCRRHVRPYGLEAGGDGFVCLPRVMRTLSRSAPQQTPRRPADVARQVDPAAESASGRGATRGRGWLVRRVLLAADLIGLVGAFLVSELMFGSLAPGGVHPEIAKLFVFFLISLPVWVIAAKIYGLYD